MVEFDPNKDFHLSKQIRRFPHPYGRKRLYTTRSPWELVDFAQGFELLVTYKLAGQPITLTYKDGTLEMADICNDGVTGFDITATVKTLADVPLQINDTDIREVRGTLMIPWKSYNELIETNRYDAKNNSPWKLIRLLLLSHSPQDFASIKTVFVAYDIGGLVEYEKKSEILRKLQELGFQAAWHDHIEKDPSVMKLAEIQNQYTPYTTDYPVTGLVFETDELFLNCFDPNTRRIMALTWPYDVKDTEFIGVRRLLADLEDLSISYKK